MQIIASLSRHTRGLYITFTPGCRVSLLEGEWGLEPARPKMSLGKKAEFASASAGMTIGALIEALEPIAGELMDAGLRAYDIYTVIDAVMLLRSSARGRGLEYMSDAQMARVRLMMGAEAHEPQAEGFDLDDILGKF